MVYAPALPRAGDTHEVWAGLKLANSVGVDPTVMVKYESPTADGADLHEPAPRHAVLIDVHIVFSVQSAQRHVGREPGHWMKRKS